MIIRIIFKFRSCQPNQLNLINIPVREWYEVAGLNTDDCDYDMVHYDTSAVVPVMYGCVCGVWKKYCTLKYYAHTYIFLSNI